MFDTADRLHEIRYPDKTESYTFDPAWNRVSEQVRNASQQLISHKTLNYNNRHQLTQISDSIDPENNATFGYDANGNQTSKTQNGETTQFVFDVRNHLRSVTTGGSTVGQFLYDYRGMRTEKQGARGTERYSHDDLAVLFQSDQNNNITALYQYGPDRLLSLTPQNQPTEFYLFDALNSPTALTRADGSISARTSFDAWGNKRRESGESFNRFGFTGHEHDEETGLIYAKARYYDPETARFLSHDPWEGDQAIPPSLHKYLYAYQNPTVYVDPDGRRACAANEFASDCDPGTGREAIKQSEARVVESSTQEKPENPRVTRNRDCIASANCSVFEMDREDGRRAAAAQQRQVAESERRPGMRDEVQDYLDDRQARWEAMRSRVNNFSRFGVAILEPDPEMALAMTAAGYVIVKTGHGVVKVYRSQREAARSGQTGRGTGDSLSARGDIHMPIARGTNILVSDRNVRLPSDVNRELGRLGFRSPYASNKEVIEGVMATNQKFVRVFSRGRTNPEGKWLVREQDIRGLSPKQIQEKFALPYTPTHVVDASVPVGTKIRMGEAGANFGRAGGGVQYELMDRLEGAFTNVRRIQ